MKKTTIGTLIFLLIASRLFSQSITNDGNYVSAIVNGSLVVQSTELSWKMEIERGGGALFTPDSKQIIYMKNDSLNFQTLGMDNSTSIADVKNYNVPKIFKGDWLTYQLKNGQVVLINLKTGVKQQFQNVKESVFDEKGNTFLLKIVPGDRKEQEELQWVSLNNPQSRIVFWSGKTGSMSKYEFDKSGAQLGFVVQDEKGNNSIWYYKEGMKQAEQVVNDKSVGIADTTEVSKDGRIFGFSKQGSKLFFTLKKKEVQTPDRKLSKVDIYSYTDPIIQSQQLARIKTDRMSERFCAVVDLSNRRVTRLQQENEFVVSGGGGIPFQLTDEYCLIFAFDGDVYRNSDRIADVYLLNESNWNKATRINAFLVSTKDGARTLLKAGIKVIGNDMPNYQLSPGGDYVIYYDEKQKNYFSYEIATGSIRNLTGTLKISWLEEDPESTTRRYSALFNSRIYWQPDGKSIFIHDHYSDLWKIDISGHNSPINLSNGIARKNNLYLQIDWGFLNGNMLSPINGSILLNGLNKDTRDRGIYTIQLNKQVSPNLLIAGAYSRLSAQMSRNSKKHIISRESSTEPLTSYFTTDFKSFIPITSHNYLHKSILLNKEVIRWKMFNGKTNFGILYKPENFDPKKKYPIIFDYYEQMAEGHINTFEDKNERSASPTNSFADVSVQYCLAHGYLIFMPDIHYTIGETGKSVYNSIVSGAQILSKLPYIDVKKMGICGHSFGGYETNLLVSHTNIFAAACSGAGATDLISYSGNPEINTYGFSYASHNEIGQDRLGVTLWERPDLYIKNSPLFYAGNINTPLLMMANKDDGAVPYIQGMELFKALRRLGKRCWLIQYDDEEHGLIIEKNRQDWGIREMQFFDHYLKDAPAPVWMTHGIPARLKGQTSGYEYDPTMKTPGPGLLMDNEGALTPQQKELLKHKTMVDNNGKIVNIPSMRSKDK